MRIHDRLGYPNPGGHSEEVHTLAQHLLMCTEPVQSADEKYAYLVLQLVWENFFVLFS